MKFPVRAKYLQEQAVIYGKTAGYDIYRVAAHVAGRRVVRAFGTYSEAQAYAERTTCRRSLSRGPWRRGFDSGQRHAFL